MNADLVLVNTHVLTMNPSQPHAQAIAVRKGKIIDVGANSKINKWIGKGTKTMDLRGKTVVPGLIDAHAHMISLSHPLPWVDLTGVSSIKQIQSRLEAKATATEKGKWILGRGWDQDRLEEQRFPTRWDLDKVSPNSPVLLNRVCGHIGVANSRALEIAGLDKQAATGFGNLVEMDSRTGEPTGILRERAVEMVWNLPKPSERDVLNACSRACKKAVKAGLTSVHWLVYDTDEIRALQKLNRLGKLPLRVYVVVPKEFFNKLSLQQPSDSFLKFRCVKIFADGSLGARTAALADPYADEPSTQGMLTSNLDELKDMFKEVDKEGFQIAVHAIGDLAVRQTLEAFEQALGKSVIKEHRHRIEHASVLSPNLIAKMKQLGLIVCVQPHFVVSDFWLVHRLGAERARWAYPFKSLIKRGILIAASSDAPAEPISPLLGIWAAVNRDSSQEERLSVKEAIEAYTINAAYFSFEESLKGSVEVGKFADFTVLADDLEKIEPKVIKDVKVEMTIVGGKIVYAASG